jgi:predicted metal-dependent peptidase
MPRRKAGPPGKPDAAENFQAGLRALGAHPMFGPLAMHVRFTRQPGNGCPLDGWAIVTTSGTVHAHPTRLGKPEEWLYVLAHCLLHLGLGHLSEDMDPSREWNAACDAYAARFLSDLKLGKAPEGIEPRVDFPVKSERKLFDEWKLSGFPDDLPCFGTGGKGGLDMFRGARERYARPRPSSEWRDFFAAGLSNAVSSAVNVAAGRERFLGAGGDASSPAYRAAQWFMSSYPLLGALAASFAIVQDLETCRSLQISVAAVDAEAKEIYLNPAAGLDDREFRFVLAHELLHVGLRHQARCLGRDPELWNVACDFVINGWLVEMGLGELPKFGGLYDPELKGLSAEAIYDRIATDMRRFRKCATLRGVGLGDMLRPNPDWWSSPDGMSLDEYYRRCLGQGLVYHGEQGRGLLPAGLVEEIRALSQPPIPWDVELAMWFDRYFAPIEKFRSYARPSRRQASTPDIPRPSWVARRDALDGRTFGVILDTSGSMERKLLAKALGAIASYSLSRDVPAARVIFCDAVAYDQGYMPPEDIADRVRVRGRGGTVLQPGIDLLEKAKDFPREGPLLVITDGQCDRLAVRREHAFLLPQGRALPFTPKGPVFRIK